MKSQEKSELSEQSQNRSKSVRFHQCFDFSRLVYLRKVRQGASRNLVSKVVMVSIIGFIKKQNRHLPTAILRTPDRQIELGTTTSTGTRLTSGVSGRLDGDAAPRSWLLGTAGGFGPPESGRP